MSTCRVIWEAWEAHSLSSEAPAAATAVQEGQLLQSVDAAGATGSTASPEGNWPLTEGLCAALAVMAEVGATYQPPCSASLSECGHLSTHVQHVSLSQGLIARVLLSRQLDGTFNVVFCKAGSVGGARQVNILCRIFLPRLQAVHAPHTCLTISLSLSDCCRSHQPGALCSMPMSQTGATSSCASTCAALQQQAPTTACVLRPAGPCRGCSSAH
jgi:hypothetical protein